jgi:hypothetical protein
MKDDVTMDAPEFFKCVVRPNYDAFGQRRDDIRLVWNAAVSMNSITEWVVLHRLGYPQLIEAELTCEANEIRKTYPTLQSLNNQVTPLKHVRSLRGIKKVDLPVTSIQSSTAYLPDDPLTWEELAVVTDEAFKTVSQFDELK